VRLRNLSRVFQPPPPLPAAFVAAGFLGWLNFFAPAFALVFLRALRVAAVLERDFVAFFRVAELAERFFAVLLTLWVDFLGMIWVCWRIRNGVFRSHYTPIRYVMSGLCAPYPSSSILAANLHQIVKARP
jgi:hypothetical protein